MLRFATPEYNLSRLGRLSGLFLFVLVIGSFASQRSYAAGSSESALAAPGCVDGQPPAMSSRFATLESGLGKALLGDPLECERPAAGAAGSSSQRTSTGLASVDQDSAFSFQSGGRRYTLEPSGTIRYWQEATTPLPPEPLYPLNGRFLMLNMHGALFHEDPYDFTENVAYARWMGAGVIRVFATDANSLKQWDGKRVGDQIADMAPIFRAGGVKLLVALVNNHQAVPGEFDHATGWMDGYQQLLLPFYTDTWRGPYLHFVRDLVSTVKERGALDVIHAWELGNELHTPQNPWAVVPFLLAAADEVRRVDPVTPLYPGTMGANHLQPWNARSPIARWIYCDSPFAAYTLHAYDWVSRERQGDMPIDWDLDYVLASPCPSGRQLPVIVEELGTSRSLNGVYAPDEELLRLEQERRQLRFVLSYPRVRGVGAWDGESPRVRDRTYNDNRRGLTSYGPGAHGGGSCYDPYPETQPGARCTLERILQALPSVP